MSVDVVSKSPSANAVVLVDTGPLDAALRQARAINSRPLRIEDDFYFVGEVLGKDEATANAARRTFMKIFHEDRVKAMGATPAQVVECSDAYTRIHRCWAASNDGKSIALPASLQFSKPGASVASVIHVAARYADSGLRSLRETYERRVADGTVEKVKAQVASTAGDLFKGLSKAAAAGLSAALSKGKSAKKD